MNSKQRWKSSRAMAVLAAFTAGAAVLAGFGLLAGKPASGDEHAATDAASPKAHFKVVRPADLLPNTAETIYQNIRGDIVAGYALARLPATRAYATWRRFNKAPYRSATHGARYVNNYANRLGEAYGRFEEAGLMPEGAILVKDSFTATADSAYFAGPVFIMEKMAAGFNQASGDWRYTMVMPDGSIFGETRGANAANVAFCIGCHATRASNDHLFFLPGDYRLKPLQVNQ